MLALVLYYVISHIFSFLCSIFEAVLLSSTHAYVALLKKKGSEAGSILEELKSNIDRPLAAILTVNTISHTVGAAGVGASIVEVFGDKWLALGSSILTLTLLYLTEMIPKTIGALHWKKLAPICARSIKILMILTFPFVFTFTFIAKMLARGKKYERITEEDIKVALESGARAGVIEEAEQDMVENIFRLGDRRVGMLMIPRVDIQWLDINSASEEIQKKVLLSKYRQFPLCEGNIDRIIGIISSRELLEKALLRKKIDVKSMAEPPLFVQENQLIFELMDLFKKTGNSVALVTDEYGSIQGMITVDDILNAIVKDIDHAGLEGYSQIFKVNTRSFLLDGKLPIDEFKEIFLLDKLPDEEKARYRTLSGLCMTQLGSIPKKGDTFFVGNLRFEILKVKNRRVEKVLLTRQDGAIGH